jgi:hypothetical protein
MQPVTTRSPLASVAPAAAARAFAPHRSSVWFGATGGAVLVAQVDLSVLSSGPGSADRGVDGEDVQVSLPVGAGALTDLEHARQPVGGGRGRR